MVQDHNAFVVVGEKVKLIAFATTLDVLWLQGVLGVDFCCCFLIDHVCIKLLST